MSNATTETKDARDFDPYHHWLGIPPGAQPPDHYRLLGLERFESDSSVIANAADRQMAHLHQYESGEYAEHVENILSELAVARICLLDPDKKSVYDQQLPGEPKTASASQQRKPTAQFDPYHQWLGIPFGQQPADHYRLLGLERFESDPSVIENSADRHLAYLSSHQAGEHAQQYQEILRELKAARACLFDLKRKSAYDKQLRQQISKSARKSTPPAPATRKPNHAVPPRTLPGAVAAADLSQPADLASNAPNGPADLTQFDLANFDQPLGRGSSGQLLSAPSFASGFPNKTRSIPLLRPFIAVDNWLAQLAGPSNRGMHIAFRACAITLPSVLLLLLVLFALQSLLTSTEVADTGTTTPSNGNEIVTENERIKPIKPPVLTPVVDMTIVAGKELTFTAEATDASGSASGLRFSLEYAPTGATIDGTTGEFRWTPDANQSGKDHRITLRVKDDVATLSAEQSFQISVKRNLPPTLQPPGNMTIIAGEELTFTGRVKDSDGSANSLGFLLLNAPTGATIGETTGQFHWIPNANQAGQDFQIILRVTDAGTPPQNAEQSFTVTVTPAPRLSRLITNSIDMKLRLIPAGEFMMGSSKSAADLDRLFGKNEEFHAREHPQHRVRITKPFYLQTTEVTQGQWEAVMGTSPWKGHRGVRGGEGSDYAAMWVTWDDATEFCRLLSAKEGREYRLPTEAEWEYACRAGTTTMYSFGDSASALQDYAWFDGNAWNIGEKHVHRVGTKRPNAWGLYDMHGNVHEWCADWYDESYYGESDELDPQGPGTGTLRMMRGDHFGSSRMRSSLREIEDAPGHTNQFIGFRVAMTAPDTNRSETPKADDGATGILNLPDGCVVAYSFDQDTIFSRGSQQYVRDLSGKDHHGLLHNVSLVEGRLGTAAKFDRAGGSHITLPDERGQYPANDFTILAWVRRATDLSDDPDGYILDLNYASSSVGSMNSGLLFFINSDGVGLDVCVPGYLALSDMMYGDLPSTPARRWAHLAVTRKRSTVTFFLDGKPDKVHSKSAAAIDYDSGGYDDNSVNIGLWKRKGHTSQTSECFQGLIDEFYLFERALSDKEIADLYKSRP